MGRDEGKFIPWVGMKARSFLGYRDEGVPIEIE